MTLAQFVPFLPEIVLAAAGFAVLLLGVPLGRGGVRPLSLFGVASLAVTGILVWLVARPVNGAETILGDMLVVDQLAVFFKLLVVAAGMVAIMMSAGFLEPLESTSIHLIQRGVIRLMQMFPHGGIVDSDRAEFNRQMDKEFRFIRDFIILHYHVTERTDSEF